MLSHTDLGNRSPTQHGTSASSFGGSAFSAALQQAVQVTERSPETTQIITDEELADSFLAGTSPTFVTLHVTMLCTPCMLTDDVNGGAATHDTRHVC